MQLIETGTRNVGPGTGKGKKAFTGPWSQVPSPQKFLGGYAEGVTPVPIPNTEVKSLRADDTARVAVWESRSPPGIIQNSPITKNVMGLCAFKISRKMKVNFFAKIYSGGIQARLEDFIEFVFNFPECL
jgi:hypothetical protein